MAKDAVRSIGKKTFVKSEMLKAILAAIKQHLIPIDLHLNKC
jgi:hypothetical protein